MSESCSAILDEVEVSEVRVKSDHQMRRNTRTVVIAVSVCTIAACLLLTFTAGRVTWLTIERQTAHETLRPRFE